MTKDPEPTRIVAERDNTRTRRPIDNPEGKSLNGKNTVTSLTEMERISVMTTMISPTAKVVGAIAAKKTQRRVSRRDRESEPDGFSQNSSTALSGCLGQSGFCSDFDSDDNEHR